MAEKEIGLGAKLRVILGVAGTLGGLSAYLLLEVFDRSALTPRLHFYLTLLAGLFFGAFMAIVGPLRLGRALISALGLGLAASGLAYWASYRFDDPMRLLDAGGAALALALLASLPLPYLIAGGQPSAGWRDYPTLFAQSWSIVVRYAAAWLFVIVVWGMLYLSDQLFQLVGITLIHDLIEMDATPYLLTGLSFGIGLAVVDELSDYVSPFLILRLLRVITPVVTLVVAVFLLALPMRGLQSLFGQISVAGVLLSMAVAATTLVSTALDGSDDEAVSNRLLVGSVQLLALMLPVLAALGGWALWLRVQEYGLTPVRITGLAGAGLLLAYGLSYAVAVLMRGRWMARIRRDNTYMALVVIALAALWLTPLVNAPALSARDQLGRYLTGKTPVGTLDLRVLRDEMGVAGRAALARLRKLAATPGHEALAKRLAAFDSGQLGGARDKYAGAEELRARLEKELPVRPEAGAEALRKRVLAAISPWQLHALQEGCARTLPSGRPGCVLVQADFLPDRPGLEALILYRDSQGTLDSAAFGAWRSDGGMSRLPSVELGPHGSARPRAIAELEAILSGKVIIQPARINALTLGGTQLVVLPR